MEVYKELENMGFFHWYSRKYGGFQHAEYSFVYDALPLDNLIRTQLNACAFKFFRETFGCDISIKKINSKDYQFIIELKHQEDNDRYFADFPFKDDDLAEYECLKKLIQIVKNKLWIQK